MASGARMDAEDALSPRRHLVWQSISALSLVARYRGPGIDHAEQDPVQSILEKLSDIDSSGSAERVDKAPTRRPLGPLDSSTEIDMICRARARLESPNWEERYATTTWLGRAGGCRTGAVVALLGCLQDEHVSVRAAAATSLAVLHQAFERGGPMLRLSVQGLVVLLNDGEVWVRLAARRALVACITIAVRAGVLDKPLIEEIEERLGDDHPSVQQAVAEVLKCCSLSDFDGTILLKRGAALMSSERAEESRRRDLECKEVQFITREAKRRHAEQREAQRRGCKYEVPESAALTTHELAVRGECPRMFMSADERREGKLRVAVMNAELKGKMKDLVEAAEERENVRRQMSNYMQSMQHTAALNKSVDPADRELQLKEAEKQANIEALGWLAERGDTRVLEAARVWLTDPSWRVRCATAITIGRVNLSDGELLRALCSWLTDDADPSVRAAAAAGLTVAFEVQVRQELSAHLLDAVSALLSALYDEEAWVRLAAERALCTFVQALGCAVMNQSSEATADWALDDPIRKVARQLVQPNQFVKDAVHTALAGAGILEKRGVSFKSNNGRARASHFSTLVAKTLADIARDSTELRECRAEACQILVAQGLWTPSILPAVELHGCCLWKSDLVIRRGAAEALCALASNNNVEYDLVSSGASETALPSELNNRAHTREVLVEMLSIGLDDFDVQVRSYALVGLQNICQAQDLQAAAALEHMLKSELDPENILRGMHCLIETNACVARGVIPCLVGHADHKVRMAARKCLEALRNDTALILQDMIEQNWVTRLECLSRLTHLHARRGTKLLSSNLLQNCIKTGYHDGDCVLAVLDRQLQLEWSIEGMRRAAPFVQKDGVKVEDEETWQALESAFTCGIELLDVSTMRIMRQRASSEGILVHLAILNGHAFAISQDALAYLREQQTCPNSWDEDLSSAVSKLLHDDNIFIKQAAARTIGDVARAGDLLALEVLMQSFSSPQNQGVVAVIMSSIGKICAIDNEDVLEFMLSHIKNPDPAVTLPILMCIAELLLGSTPSSLGSKFFQICEELLVEGSNIDESIRRALKWAISRLDDIYNASKLSPEIDRKQKRMLALKAKQEERIRRRQQDEALREGKVRRTKERALAELASDVGARRFNALGVLADLGDFESDAVTAISNALCDELPRVRARAMSLLRQCAKLASSTVISKLLDVIRRRDTGISVHAVMILGEIVPRGTQEVITLLLDQLNAQKINYLGSGHRRCIWDRISGFRQATLQALFRIMPHGESKAFVLSLALEDLDSSVTRVRNDAFEVIAQQVSEDEPYTIVMVKMIGMLKAKNCEKRHFAVQALKEISRPQDMRLLLALRKVLEDEAQDGTTRVLAAQTMLHIDANDVGVQTAIQGVIHAFSSSRVSTEACRHEDLPNLPAAGNVSYDPTAPVAAPELSTRLHMVLYGSRGYDAPRTLKIPSEAGEESDARHLKSTNTEATTHLETTGNLRDLSLKVKVLQVPQSFSKIGKSMDGVRKLRRDVGLGQTFHR